VLSGIQYPKTIKNLVEFGSRKASTISQELFDLISSLPDRTYRDSAEVALALGELKSVKKLGVQERVKKWKNQAAR